MDYQLLLSSRVNCTPAEFRNAWNAEAEMHAVAQAQLTPAPPELYDPLTDLVMLVLTNVGLGLGTNALYDLIKKVFAKKNPKKHIRIMQIDQPDGTHFLMIDIEE